MTSRNAPSNARLAVLNAATEIVQEGGPGDLTLDAAAARAGVSKGGLLYHFPSKGALVAGMIEQALQRFEEDVERLAPEEKPGPGQWLRAFVRLTFAAEPEHVPGISLLAAAAISPDELEPVNRYFARWQERGSQDGLDPDIVAVIRLASDGLWFGDMFNAAAPQGGLRASVLSTLLEMISQSEESREQG